MEDDFLTALTYAIKEEIVDNYFYARRVIEDEKAQVEEAVEAQKELAEKVRRALAKLVGLLVDADSIALFWRELGLDRPAAADRSELEAADRATSGWRWRKRYRRLVRQAALELAQAAEAHQAALEDLGRLADEVNEDIDHFHANFDFLLLKSVLSQMDPDLLEKKHFLGCSLDGEGCLDLERALRFSKSKVFLDRLRVVPAMPSPERVERAAEAAASLALKRHPERVRRLLGLLA